MTQTEIKEKNNRKAIGRFDYTLIGAIVLVFSTGLLVQNPANLYIWTVGIAGIIVVKNLL